MEEVRSCEHAIFGDHPHSRRVRATILPFYQHRRLPDLPIQPTTKRLKQRNKPNETLYLCMRLALANTDIRFAAIFSSSSHSCSSHFNGGMCEGGRHCMEWNTYMSGEYFDVLRSCSLRSVSCSLVLPNFMSKKNNLKFSYVFLSLVGCCCTASVWM